MKIRASSFIFLLATAAFALVLMYAVYLLSPADTPAPGAPFLVSRGDGMREIVAGLFGQRLIRSEAAFKFYSIFTGQAHQLKPGAYDIDPASTTPEIVRLLARGPALDRQVLINEGMTMAEIDALLTEQGVIEKNALNTFPVSELASQYPFLASVKSFEGFLFPDTYRFYVESSPEAVFKIFLDNFQKRAWPILTRGTKKPYDALIIASLIEKEVPESNDRLLVSGIIAKRLKISMPLQIDATLPYARLNGERYDTYTYYGLPPTPISNPGLDSISAALHPQNSSYLYYLSDPKTGRTIFSKTFDEHDENRAVYLRGK